VAIVRASYQLSDGAKHVFALLSEVDRGGGCWMSPQELAAQLGMSFNHFKELRVELQRLKLLVKRPIDGSRLDLWFTCLLHGFEAEPPVGASIEERRRWVRDGADYLDRCIQEVRGAGTSGQGASPNSEVRNSGLARPEVPASSGRERPEIPMAPASASSPTVFATA